MKQDVLDVLLYLFEYYADDGWDEGPARQWLESELSDAGFNNSDVSRAFDWLEQLSASAQTIIPNAPHGLATRVYCDEEQMRLDVECRGFILSLEQIGILNTQSRELVIDRIMALDSDYIDLEQVKWVTLLVLFSQPDEMDAYIQLEEIIFDGFVQYLH